MFQGSCLCGCIQYQVKKFTGPFLFCHCTRCRKAGGSAFASNCMIKIDDFELLSGKDQLKGFDAGTGVIRKFCRNCGSPIYSQREAEPEILRLRMGTVDTPLNHVIKPSAHIFVDSKAEWDEINDNLPQHSGKP